MIKRYHEIIHKLSVIKVFELATLSMTLNFSLLLSFPFCFDSTQLILIKEFNHGIDCFSRYFLSMKNIYHGGFIYSQGNMKSRHKTRQRRSKFLRSFYVAQQTKFRGLQPESMVGPVGCLGNPQSYGLHHY